MKKGFVVSAVLYPILIITLTLILSIIAMTDNRRKILDHMKLEVSEENAVDPEMTNSELFHRLKALEEAFAELKANTSEDRFEEMEYSINEMWKKIYPVGSIFTSTINTNPGTYLGGTWVAFGSGKTLVGVNPSETEFNSVEKTGGNKTNLVTLTTENLPAHTHTIPSLTGTAEEAGAHTHSRGTMNITGRFGQTTRYSAGDMANRTYGAFSFTNQKNPAQSAQTNPNDVGGYIDFNASNSWSGVTSSEGNHVHSITTTASTTGISGNNTAITINNTQPYITVYFWKRTA